MNVIVCVKQIPDPAMPGELDSSTNTLKREGKLILDEPNTYAGEMALHFSPARAVAGGGGGGGGGGGVVGCDQTKRRGGGGGRGGGGAGGPPRGILVSDPSLQ